MSEHQEAGHLERTQYSVACDCGWVSPWCDSEEAAEGELSIHLEWASFAAAGTT